ncbi:hypothetical protein O181_083052 [Austropuccinia psidii MF-1]|uniref:Uncharacterized protein n=1 Tax=Austropuccinia psidii MF-1 TaxID=1389203 RepID=A0A9Q3FRM9_9BASI|nr:hypothetical protein [Austropuccinia psidii MF-1]
MLISGTIHYHQIYRENSVEVKLTDSLSRKHPVFPVSLVKPYHKTSEDTFPSRSKIHTPQDIVKVVDSPSPLNKIIKPRKIRFNGKEHRQYLIIFKNQTADKYKLLEEDAIIDGEVHLKRLRASKRDKKSHK